MNRAWLLASAAVTGATGMGFEMVASRYLTPWFGGGLDVWASLIATVMAGMAMGYVAGGRLVDRMPTPAVGASAMCAAAAWLALVPTLAQPAIRTAVALLGDAGPGAIAAAAMIAGPPMALLAIAPPVAIRVLTDDARRSGGVAGLIYGISTAGSIAGVLGTAFGLIPHVGTNATTRLMAGLLAFAAAGLTISTRAAPAARGNGNATT